MLVVISIIAVLAALLLPAITRALNTARNTAIAVEINQLASAIEAYKQDKGDYPPNFGDSAIVLRHIRKCYPKADTAYVTAFVTRACTRSATPPEYFIDEGESLVFWLSMKVQMVSGGYVENIRLQTTRDVRAYVNKSCKDTPYIYIDSRSYDNPATDTNDLVRFVSPDGADMWAYGEDKATHVVRPYWSSTKTGNTGTFKRLVYKPINPTTFQLICAGQDGEYGSVIPGDSDVKIAAGDAAGTNFNTNKADHDNIANFSNGKTLGDNIP
jgi:hypothetical protein